MIFKTMFLNLSFFFRPIRSREHQVIPGRRGEESLRLGVGGPVYHPYHGLQVAVQAYRRQLHPHQRRPRQRSRLDRGPRCSAQQRRSLLLRQVRHRESGSGIALPRPDLKQQQLRLRSLLPTFQIWNKGSR